MDHYLRQEAWLSIHAPTAKLGMDPLITTPHDVHTLSPWPGEGALAPSHLSGLAVALVPAPPPHILVIDDSPTVCKIVAICHRRAGFVVRSLKDGIEALQWLSRSQASIPPLIYLDIELPRMDGYAVAQRLRARPDFAHTTLILLSGRDRVIDRLKGRLAGAKAYVTKPFKEQELLAITQSYLGLAPHVSLAQSMHP